MTSDKMNYRWTELKTSEGMHRTEKNGGRGTLKKMVLKLFNGAPMLYQITIDPIWGFFPQLIV